MSEMFDISMISIHAPAKGATLFKFDSPVDDYISIHAPAKGATCVGALGYLFYRISIHAPAKGATKKSFMN